MSKCLHVASHATPSSSIGYWAPLWIVEPSYDDDDDDDDDDEME